MKSIKKRLLTSIDHPKRENAAIECDYGIKPVLDGLYETAVLYFVFRVITADMIENNKRNMI